MKVFKFYQSLRSGPPEATSSTKVNPGRKTAASRNFYYSYQIDQTNLILMKNHRTGSVHRLDGIGESKLRECFCIGLGGTWIATDTKTSTATSLTIHFDFCNLNSDHYLTSYILST